MALYDLVIRAEVPATTVHRISRDGDGDHEADGPQKKKRKLTQNVNRDLMRSFRHYGVGWQVPIETYRYVQGATSLDVHYLSPEKLLTFLIENHPAVLFGEPDMSKVKSILQGFWEGYRKFHDTHCVFSQFGRNEIHRVIPLAIHGDEGRGRRRSSTTVVCLEAILGLKGHVGPCSTCVPSGLCRWQMDVGAEHPSLKTMRSNLKGASMVQHWPLFVLPGTLHRFYKPLTFKLLEEIATILNRCFYHGVNARGEKWHLAIIGSKGDLKWFSKICCLTRGYERQGIVNNIPMCHHCLAGGPGLPPEDVVQETPAWCNTIYTQRPWSIVKPPALRDLPFDSNIPEALYRHDLFHVLKLGLFRDLTGSIVFLFLRWDVFGAAGKVEDKLNSAFGSFTLFCKAEGHSPALRSFTPRLFNYSSRRSFPWMNIKASDCTLVMRWLRVLTIGVKTEGSHYWQIPILDVIHGVLCMGLEFYRILTTHGLWLTRACAATAYEKGQAVITGYSWLANWTMMNHFNLFSLKPKLHFYKHVVLDLKLQLDRGNVRVLSPISWECSQNEDMIGLISRLSRRVDSKVVTRRCLQFFSVEGSCLIEAAPPRLLKKTLWLLGGDWDGTGVSA